jgi:hypothetical protein
MRVPSSDVDVDGSATKGDEALYENHMLVHR